MSNVKAQVDYEYKVSGTEAASQGMENMATSGVAAAAAIAAIAAAAITASKALYDMVVESAALNAALYNNATAANVTVEEYQALNYVLRQTTGQTDGAGRSLRAINTFLLSAGEGAKRYRDVLDDLNLRYEDLIRLDPTERYLTITDAIGRLSNATEQNLAATAVFGTRYATQVVAALNQADGSMRNMIDTFQDSSMQISTENVEGLKAFDDAMTDLQMSADNLRAGFAAGLAPSIQEINQVVMDLLPLIKEELADALPILQQLAERIALDMQRYGPTIITVMGKIIDIVAIATERFEDLEKAARWAVGPVGTIADLIEMLGDTNVDTARKTEWFSDAMANTIGVMLQYGQSLHQPIQYTGDLAEQVLTLTNYTKNLSREQAVAVMSTIELTRAEFMRSAALKGGITPAIEHQLELLDRYVISVKDATASARDAASASGAGGMGGFAGGITELDVLEETLSKEEQLIALRQLSGMQAQERAAIMAAKQNEIFTQQVQQEQQLAMMRAQQMQMISDRSIDIIVGGFTGGFDSVIDGFKNMLAQMATEYLKSAIFRALIGGGVKAATGGAGFFV